MRAAARATTVLATLGMIGCSQHADTEDDNGYPPIDAMKAAPVRKAVDDWHGCIVYGIRQVDQPGESAIAVAEGAMAGCMRAETNLEDRLFDAMSGAGDDPKEVRALAHDTVEGFRERMRSVAIRLVLSKHEERPQSANKVT